MICTPIRLFPFSWGRFHLQILCVLCVHPGEIFKNPALASTLKKVQAGGAAAFYNGSVAQAYQEYASPRLASPPRGERAPRPLPLPSCHTIAIDSRRVKETMIRTQLEIKHRAVLPLQTSRFTLNP